MTGTRVTFYVLDADDPGARLAFGCRLAEKVWKLRQRVHAVVADAGAAAALDELLWTFRQGSFVPHEVVASGAAPEAPVTIGLDAATAPEADVLINLTGDVPAGFERYPRVAEIVTADANDRAAGRQRHRAYQAAGLAPETHAVAAGS
jgi:DNA polymerase-3 subunit chi